MFWRQISRCEHCGVSVSRALEAPELSLISRVSYYIPQLCDQCLCDGWRFDCTGDIVNVKQGYDDDEISLFDILTSEEGE